MSVKRTLFVLTILTLLLASIVPAAHAQTAVSEDILAQFDQLVQSEMTYFNIPGAAVAVVEGDKVVYSKGFGVRDLASGNPFTTETRFRIGSTTKSMTSLLIAQLVDEGVLSWDTPVTDLLPDFKTVDPALTAKITVGDLMGMATGLVASDVNPLYWGDWNVNDIFSAISTMSVGGDFRQFYDYNNEVYSLSGYAGAAASKLPLTLDSYKSLMQQHVFDPIGMKSAIITDDTTALGDNFSESYETSLLTGSPTLMQNPPVGVLAPAGGVWTNIEDMARYVMTQVNGGVSPDGTRIVDEATLAKTWEPSVADKVNFPGVENTVYGKGWVTETYFGIPERYHNGGWAGYKTQMLVLPEDHVGLIIFTNSNAGDLFNPLLSYSFIELVRGLKPSAADAIHAYAEKSNAQIAQARALVSTQVTDVADYLGTYENGWKLEQQDDGSLWFSREGWSFQIGYIAVTKQYIVLNNIAAGASVSFDKQGDSISLVISQDDQPLMSLKKTG